MGKGGLRKPRQTLCTAPVFRPVGFTGPPLHPPETPLARNRLPTNRVPSSLAARGPRPKTSRRVPPPGVLLQAKRQGGNLKTPVQIGPLVPYSRSILPVGAPCHPSFQCKPWESPKALPPGPSRRRIPSALRTAFVCSRANQVPTGKSNCRPESSAASHRPSARTAPLFFSTAAARPPAELAGLPRPAIAVLPPRRPPPPLPTEG